MWVVRFSRLIGKFDSTVSRETAQVAQPVRLWYKRNAR